MSSAEFSLPSIDLSRVKERVAKEKPTWTEAFIETALREYRRFWVLCKVFPDINHVPSKSVDEVWHAHILHTRDYARDCQQYFGCFLHHAPSYGEERMAQDQEDYQNMITKYNGLFGEAPQKVWGKVNLTAKAGTCGSGTCSAGNCSGKVTEAGTAGTCGSGTCSAGNCSGKVTEAGTCGSGTCSAGNCSGKVTEAGTCGSGTCSAGNCSGKVTEAGTCGSGTCSAGNCSGKVTEVGTCGSGTCGSLSCGTGKTQTPVINVH
eukprot:TRINITY_DN784_c0_g1_i7.p1 TRINITY_DN784_c0_g1~~TRINITY_DN784_c0_g1_i7.p1  ORF type:complete len:272 (+),score=27.22 TRINITY_DN784_c0_g1_i7:31-816(+)